MSNHLQGEIAGKSPCDGPSEAGRAEGVGTSTVDAHPSSELAALYYDPASDDMVFESVHVSPVRLYPICDENTSGENRERLVRYAERVRISPGRWRISATDGICGLVDDVADHCDILLLRRRYCAQSIVSMQETGSKRKTESADAGQKKRELEEHRSLILTSTPPVEDKRSTIPSDGNPFSNVEPGRTVAIRPCSILNSYNHSLALQTSLANANNVSEHYSVSNMRDIVVSESTTIFYGRHSVHGLIAVKLVRQRFLVDRPLMSMCVRLWGREKAALEHLDHPCIVKFFGADARFFSLYIEYLPHPDLTKLMDRPGHTFQGTTDDAIRVLGDMASALDYLTTRGIIHNDIKPGNILYDGVRGAVLIDFGLAAFAEERANTGGTCWYMAPEVKRTRERGPKSDIFALGITLLYLLRKLPLPNMRSGRWKVGRAVRADEVEAGKMEKWLQEVFGMSLQLEDDGIEGLVKQMLEEDAQSRISARLLVQAYPKLIE
ncbi:hypothetical protein E4U21_005110 [Claviceps maximensis]|nr:hypothetical protein E4U21_005110 [Claviceps maximensis]